MSNAKKTLKVGDKSYDYFDLKEVAGEGLDRLPFSLRVLLENLLRHEDGRVVTKGDIDALLNWDPKAKPAQEIAYHPARVLLQDFTGVPAVVDLAAMRDAIKEMGGDPQKINPLQPADLVIDHSVQVDHFAQKDALTLNGRLEFQRNHERYLFLRWGQKSFENFRVVPPETGIVHQVNLEYLAPGLFSKDGVAYPDTLVGTDSHTTMINGLGVLGWGVGGIEAEAAMLGQPVSMLIPQVVGFKLKGKLSPGANATDLVLRVVEMLREKGVVGKFVEFYGPGISELSLANRATIANMAPEYGATMGFFPIDAETLDYLKFTNRKGEAVALTEAYCRAQGLFHTKDTVEPEFTDTLELDMGDVVPSISGPKRPQDRIALSESQPKIHQVTKDLGAADIHQSFNVEGEDFELTQGDVVIAAITSCTNTSNPAVMLGAGLLAKKAVELGLDVKPWVKTSLAPGSKVVREYLTEAGLLKDLETLGFNVVGYGCTTCIGNSGPLPPAIAKTIDQNKMVVASALSGNRNFEGRISPHVRMNYLASPPLVVAYAIAGTMYIDFDKDPLGKSKDGQDIYLKDIWPSSEEVQSAIRNAVKPSQFADQYGSVFEGDSRWKNLETPEGEFYAWDEKSTYVRRPSFLMNLPKNPEPLADIKDARVLALLGDSVTTDHISPAGAIPHESPTADYLRANGVEVKDFNSYGSRRGNHEVMMRGTFGNIRLRNQLVPGVEGGYTKYLPSGEQMSIFDASMKYQAEGTSLVVLAGKEYGTGSSRDWAAKGTLLLGVKAVITESYERIHRSNLVGMGVLPLQYMEGVSAESLGLDGSEHFTITGISDGLKPGDTVDVSVNDGAKTFKALVRLDTPNEVDYYRHGGILVYVLRQLLAA